VGIVALDPAREKALTTHPPTEGRGRTPTDEDRERLAKKARSFFEEIWSEGDFWQLERSKLNQASFACQRSLLDDRRYRRVLELGCGAGLFTRKLAEIADEVVAIDVAPSAIEQARTLGLESVDFRVANIMDYDPRSEGPWISSL
jgi:2-polyprenyl-3-methyl-5-hydroxy-6-metoxy-1,4-benzoquinol methylase